MFSVQSSMKKTLAFTPRAFLVSLAATMLLVGCVPHKGTKQFDGAPGPVYETAELIKTMPHCKAKVVQRGPCFLYLTTADGKGFYLGSPGSQADVGLFLDTLKDGHRYVFPDAFLQYQKHQPTP